MALLCGMGFPGSANESRSFGGTYSVQNTTAYNSEGYSLQINPTTTGTGYVDAGYHSGTGIITTFSSNGIYFYGRFRIDTLPSANSEPVVSVHRGGGLYIGEVRVTSTGAIAIYDSSTTLIATSGSTISTTTWYDFEFRFDNSGGAGAGIFEVKINGTSFVSTTTATLDAAIAFGRVRLGKANNRNSQAVNFFWQHILIDEDGWIGQGIASAVALMTGAGSYAAWTSGTGSTYTEVDDLPDDGDTTYVRDNTGTGTPRITFVSQSMATLGKSGSTIHSVKAFLIGRDEGGSSTWKALSISDPGGTPTESVSSGFDPGPTYGSSCAGQLAKTDPDTGAAWTETGVDNVEIGAERGSAGDAIRMTAMCKIVFYYESAGASSLVYRPRPMAAMMGR